MLKKADEMIEQRKQDRDEVSRADRLLNQRDEFVRRQEAEKEAAREREELLCIEMSEAIL